MSQNRRTVLDRFIDERVRKNKQTGQALAVARRGRNVITRSIGFRDRENRLPVTPQTVFGVASITKSFTCVSILQLQEAGKLSVRDSVVKHLPRFRTPTPRWTRRIRLHHLMTHSSGLPPHPAGYYDLARSMLVDFAVDVKAYRRAGVDLRHAPIDTYEQLMDCLAEPRYRLLGPPGTQFSYSNEGYGLLGAVIEAASGERYERYVEDHILRPAGMSHASFDTGVVLRFPEVAQLYTTVKHHKRSRVVAAPVWWGESACRAAGALRMSLEDLMRYLEIYRTSGRVERTRILSEASVGAMTRPYIEASPFWKYGYGLGLITDDRGVGWVSHSGGLKGVASFFLVAPEKQITGAALSNFDGFASGGLLVGAVNSVLGVSPKAPLRRPPKKVPPSRALGAYAGLYGCGEGYWLRVKPRPGGLFIDFIGIEVTERGIKARSVGPDLFASGPKGSSVLYQFFSGPNGRISAVGSGWRYIRRRSKRDYSRAIEGKLIW